MELSVVDWMEKYRIGNLSEEDTLKSRNFQHGDMYETDPPRDPNLLPCTKVSYANDEAKNYAFILLLSSLCCL